MTMVALAMVMQEVTMQLAARRMMTTIWEEVVVVEGVLQNSENWKSCQTLAQCPV